MAARFGHGRSWRLRTASEHSVSLVRLDVLPDPAAREAADSVRAWLLERQVIAPNDRLDPLWQPSAWKPGPRAREVADAPWSDAFLTTADNGVDIAADRDCYHPVENDEPPRCRQCSAPAPPAYDQGYDTWLGRWLQDGAEPRFTCGGCGWAALAGDRDGEFSVVVGAPAVTFRNWPELAAGFTTEARVKLGGRTAVVRSHM